jgi:copper chaperone NosL
MNIESFMRQMLRNTHDGLRNTLILSILLLALIACSSNANTDPTPPTIHYGEDICELCGMIISEETYAAAYVTGNGHGHTFDDIGDMIQAYLRMKENVRAFFVHDYDSQDWIRAETAHYVLSHDLPTPMLSGLAAFASAAKATDFATEMDGKMLTFDELLTNYHESPPTSGAHHTGH